VTGLKLYKAIVYSITILDMLGMSSLNAYIYTCKLRFFLARFVIYKDSAQSKNYFYYDFTSFQ